jgi:hypothetical protein
MCINVTTERLIDYKHPKAIKFHARPHIVYMSRLTVYKHGYHLTRDGALLNVYCNLRTSIPKCQWLK